MVHITLSSDKMHNCIPYLFLLPACIQRGVRWTFQSLDVRHPMVARRRPVGKNLDRGDDSKADETQTDFTGNSTVTS